MRLIMTQRDGVVKYILTLIRALIYLTDLASADVGRLP